MNNIANPDGEVKTFQFGKDAELDNRHLDLLKTRLTPVMRQRLGILTISNANLMKELASINTGILEGIPRREIIEQCDDEECIEEVIQPGKECPPQETIENVEEEYVEICSTDSLICPQQPPPRETQCTFEDCSFFAKKQCDSIIDSSKTE